MKRFVIYRLDGRILGYTHAHEQPNIDDHLYVESQVGDVDTHWVNNGVVTEYSPEAKDALANPPGPGFEWVPALGKWLDMRPLEQAKADAWSTIKRMREQAFAARAISPNGVAYSITADKANLADRLASLDAAISLGAATETTTIQWRDRDNVAHELSITGLRVLAAAMGARGQAIYEHSWALDAQVKAATSSGQLVAIDLEAGWP